MSEGLPAHLFETQLGLAYGSLESSVTGEPAVLRSHRRAFVLGDRGGGLEFPERGMSQAENPIDCIGCATQPLCNMMPYS